MFAELLDKIIPRSLRAGAALAVIILFLPVGLSSLPSILTGIDNSAWSITKGIGSLIIGIIAGIAFHHFQAEDSGTPAVNELEVLDKHFKRVRSNESPKATEIKAVFTSHDVPSHTESKKDLFN